MYFMGSSVSNRYFGGGVKCYFLNIGVKNANGWIYSSGDKVHFPLFSTPVCTFLFFSP
jgi:hypothetical protein